MKVRGFDLGGMRIEVIADAAGLQFRRFNQRAIEGGEECFSAIGKSFPRIFSIKNDRGDAASLGGELGDILEVIDEMGNGLGGFISRRIKADKIGKGTFTEKGLDGGSTCIDSSSSLRKSS